MTHRVTKFSSWVDTVKDIVSDLKLCRKKRLTEVTDLLDNVAEAKYGTKVGFPATESAWYG